MSILIQKAGILGTVQDLGRFGHRRFGINTGGAMDRTAVRLINILLGNDESAAVLEMHFPASEIVFETTANFAVGGADFCPQLDNAAIQNWRSHSAEAGSVLRFSEKRLGNRAYLAVSGGFDVDNWLGSSSTNLVAGVGGFRGRKLQVGDRIRFARPNSFRSRPAGVISPAIIPRYGNFPTVRVIAGNDFENLRSESKDAFEKQGYKISVHSDRMGFRLASDPLYVKTPNAELSSAVSFGTVQLLPDGQLIVLMADHQTTGGYPRIAHVIDRDLPVAAQLGAGDGIGFHMVSLAEAEALFFERERDLALFRVACR